MKVAVYPGSFDPITNGHFDIIKRSAKIFDEVIVAVLVNPSKEGLFTPEERVKMIEKVVSKLSNVKVTSFKGLLVDLMEEVNSNIIIKGLRAVSDFEYEFQMALMNNKLDPNVETVFMMTNAKYSYLSSSAVKQVARFDGCIIGLVPEKIIGEIQAKIKTIK